MKISDTALAGLLGLGVAALLVLASATAEGLECGPPADEPQEQAVVTMPVPPQRWGPVWLSCVESGDPEWPVLCQGANTPLMLCTGFTPGLLDQCFSAEHVRSEEESTQRMLEAVQ